MANQLPNLYVGIDYGMANTRVVCYILNSQQFEIILERERNYFPSVLSFDPSYWERYHSTSFGSVACVCKPTDFFYKISEAKRFIGLKYSDIPDETQNELFPNVVEGEDGYCVYQIKNPENVSESMEVTPTEAIAIQLAHIKQTFDRLFGDQINEIRVVVTVPSYFNSKQKDEMVKAYKIAGFKVISVMNESSAALYHCNKMLAQSIERAMIIDISHKTMDVSICEQHNGRYRTKGIKHNLNCGGDICDDIMMELILDKMREIEYVKINDFIINRGKDLGIRRKKKERNLVRLRKEANRAKEYLSLEEVFKVNMDEIILNGDNDDIEIYVSRDEYEQRIEQTILPQIERCINESLQSSRIEQRNIDKIILVGGTTQIPIIQRKIKEMFGENKIMYHKDFDPTFSVAKGACEYGLHLDEHLMFDDNDEDDEEIIRIRDRISKYFPQN